MKMFYGRIVLWLLILFGKYLICFAQPEELVPEEPVVTCPADVTVGTDPGEPSETVGWIVTVTDNIDTDLIATCTPSSQSSFYVGTTTVTCTSTDRNNNIGSCNFTVNVVDNEKPNMVCPDDIVLGTIITQSLATWSKPTVNDNVDTGLLTTCTPPSGTSFNVGSTKVTCFAIDVAGNEANCTFRVYVIEDHKSPTLVCPANVDETTESNQATLTWTGPVVGDNVDSGLSASCSPSSGSSFYVGSTNVTCNAYDMAGNEGKCMFVVNVIGINNTSSVPGYLVIVVVIVCIFILVMFSAMLYCRSYHARKNERNINDDDVEIPKPKTSINAPGNIEEISMRSGNAVYVNDAVKRRARMNIPRYIDAKLPPLPPPLPRKTNPEHEDLHTYIEIDSAYTNPKK
ncbi:hyalin-like [Anneissia japonica]|uniref:hyalin-like n=1 Tax=Anneissia japonica TaxID=1529436 RepID=UPI001425B5C7|nr:hyalin-like [Anneissia japonica]